jgi:hypothetical protein
LKRAKQAPPQQYILHRLLRPGAVKVDEVKLSQKGKRLMIFGAGAVQTEKSRRMRIMSD